MNTKTTLPISEARKKIFEIADDVVRSSRRYTITEKGRPKAVILSAEEFESWQETLGIMRDFPNLAKESKEAREQYKKGEYITLDELIAREGFLPANKPKRKHGLSAHHSKKSSKTA